MNVFMIARGSQGDVIPYLTAAKELTRRGHHVAINLPTAFKEHAERAGVKYYLQTEDNIKEIMDDKLEDMAAVKWIGRLMDFQCSWLPGVLGDYDVLVSANTEMASPTLAEYFNIPLIRTAYAPIIPSKLIPPPLIPYPVPHPILTPRFIWFLTRIGGFPPLKPIINRHRKNFGLKPLRTLEDFRMYTSGSFHNALCYSSLLCAPDPEWNKISFINTGYCFRNDEPYDERELQNVLDFIHQDSRPVVFFTIGSCEYPKSREFFDSLAAAVHALNYRMLVGAGWSKSMNQLTSGKDIYVMKGYLPHSRILPECSAIVHHAGSGTTHQAVLSGTPQLHLPLIIDQHFWSYQCLKLGLSPHWINEKKYDQKELMAKLTDVVTNPIYKQNAKALAVKMSREDGIKTLCDYIESKVKK